MTRKGRQVRQIQGQIVAEKEPRGSLFAKVMRVAIKGKSKKYETPDFADGNVPVGCTSGDLAQQIAALEAAGKTVIVGDDGKSLNWY